MTPRAWCVAAVAAAWAMVIAAAGAGWHGLAVVALIVVCGLTATVAATVFASPPARPRGHVDTAPRVPGLLRRLPLPRFSPLRGRPDAATGLTELDRCTRAVARALSGPREADIALRPVLAGVADVVVAARTGVRLTDGASGAEGLLGKELAEFVDPARRVRGHDDGPAPTLADVERLLGRLEGLL